MKRYLLNAMEAQAEKFWRHKLANFIEMCRSSMSLTLWKIIWDIHKQSIHEKLGWNWNYEKREILEPKLT